MFSLTGLAFAQNASANLSALVIGNANYPDSDDPLTTPLEDVRALAGELQRRGAAVDIGQDLTKRTLREAIARFVDKLRPGSVAFLHFSGYAIQSARQNYLIPIDAQIWTEADVQREGLNLDRILSDIARKEVSSAFVVLDGAHRNPFERRFRSFSTGLAAIETPPEKVAVMFSAAPGAVLPQNRSPRSRFGMELVKQIEAAGVSPQAFHATRTAVAEATRNEQSPWVSIPPPAAPRPAPPAPSASAQAPVSPPAPASRPGPAFAPSSPAPAPVPNAGPPPAASAQAPVLNPGPSSPPPAQAASPAPPAPSAQATLTLNPPPAPQPPAGPAPPDAEADFRQAQQKGTRQAYEELVAKHKSGMYVDMARAEIARLDEALAQAKKPEPRVKPYSAENARSLRELTERIDRNPQDAAAIHRRGLLYALHEDYPRALADFDRVVALNMRDPATLNNRCWIRAVLNQLDGALADCNEALNQRPNFVDALDSRGLVNLKIGLPRRAVADYDAALKVDAKHPSALYGRGMARLRLGEVTEGNGDIKQALAINPNVAEDFARWGIR